MKFLPWLIVGLGGIPSELREVLAHASIDMSARIVSEIAVELLLSEEQDPQSRR